MLTVEVSESYSVKNVQNEDESDQSTEAKPIPICIGKETSALQDLNA